MLFDNWEGIEGTLIIGVLAYIVIVAWLRIAGKRTLSKWNAFDFIVTIALGSMLASIVLSKDVALAEGAVALGVLMGLQYLITWLSVRVAWVRHLIKAEPSLLLQHGRILHDTLKKQRVTESELRTAIRAKGIAAVEDVYAVVLETDGTFSVIRNVDAGSRSALVDVPGISSDTSKRSD